MESIRVIDEDGKEYQREVNGGYASGQEKPAEINSKPSSGRAKTHCSYNVRVEHRRRLSRLLGQLVKRHNWNSASGVLSILLKGTCRERCPMLNRKKYWVAMEVLNKIEGDLINPRKIKHIHEIWMRKNGGTKNQPKDKYSIQLQYVLYCLKCGQLEEAHQAIICLMQETERGRDPVINMMAGMVFYEIWYSSIPEEMKLRSSDICCTPTVSEISGMESYNPIYNSNGFNSLDVQDVTSPIQCDSDTSISNNKKLPVEIDGDSQRKPTNRVFQPQGFYMQDSAEVNENDVSLSDHGADLINASIFSSCGLDASLLPIRWPDSNENMEDSIRLYMETLKNYYYSAVKHLQVALHSTPPLLEATLPLIQLLLLGNEVNEALNELESLHHKSNAVLPIRLRAILLECFDGKNSTVLATCYEDILMKDPTCGNSLTKLISMHRNGEYSVESLVEMIALHLDATYPAGSVWEDLAMCLLKLSQCEEDQVSVNNNVNKVVGRAVSVNVISSTFISERSRKSWMLRHRWWATRHFSKNTLVSELEACDLKLLPSKAACASHLYGPDFEYVVSVYTYLEKEDDRDRISFLRMHMKNSVQLFENFKRTT